LKKLLTYLFAAGLLAVWLLSYLTMTADADPPHTEHTKATMSEITLDELEAAENELIEAALLARSTKLEDVTITFYCCEERPHICGTGSGITASGRRVTPYVSCAVDPAVIPLGSTIMIERNGEMLYLRADDTGPAIRGNRLDIAVQGHQEALSLGVKTADIWWCEE
jgi:3D (Asp-Asp-Asp) domain-containing protein